MRTYPLTDFQLPDTQRDPDVSSREGIWLLQHAGSECRRLILFVHGLGGHPTKTWGKFPEFAFSALPTYDIGLYGYSSAYFSNLIPLLRRQKLVACARTLRREVWEHLLVQCGYEEVVLVGHSLGGVVVKAVAQQIEDHDSNRDDYFQRIHSMFFFGTPHFGSDRVRMGIWLLSPMLAALRRNAPELERVRDFWQYKVALDDLDHRKNRVFIHARAIYSDKDFWVDAVSAQGEFEDDQKYPSRVAHSRLVKPAYREDGHFTYFVSQVNRISELRDAGTRFTP